MTVQLLPEAWPEAQERDADDVENAADTSGNMIEIAVGGHAETSNTQWPTLHRFGLHCLLPRLWSVILLPTFRRFRFSRLQVVFLAPPLPILLPLLLYLDVGLRFRLQHPLLGLALQLMVVFAGVVLVVEVMVVVVVRDRAREMGVPKRGWRTQLGCAGSFPKVCCHLQRKHTERRLLPLEARLEARLRERG